MKILIAFLLLLSFSSNAQTWEAMEKPILGANRLCVYNNQVVTGTTGGYVLSYNGTSWDTLGGKFSGSVMALEVYNSELYAAGKYSFNGTTTVNNIARFDGTDWVEIGGGLSSQGNDLTVYNNELYVCGSFLTAGGVSAPYIASWDGSQWNSAGTGLNNSGEKLEEMNNELYVLGKFTTAGSGTANNIAKWNGTQWSSLGTGLTLSPSNTFYRPAMKAFNGNLYVSDFYLVAAGSVSLSFPFAVWNGSAWQAGPSPGAIPYSFMMASSSTNLYCTKILSKGQTYTLPPSSLQDQNFTLLDTAYVTDFLYFNNRLYLCGEIFLAGFNRYDMAQIDLTPVATSLKSSNSVPLGIYPNPATSYVMISMQEKGVYQGSLYNEGGVFMDRVSFSGQNFKLNLHDLPPGNYFLQLEGEGRKFTKTVVVE